MIRVHDPAFIGPRVEMGEGCKIQMFAFIPDNVILGKNVFVGPHACFTNDKYPPSNGAWKDTKKTVVGDNASIGAGAIILPGVGIGMGAMVGAGAVVTKDIPPGETWAGNPAVRVDRRKLIRMVPPHPSAQTEGET